MLQQFQCGFVREAPGGVQGPKQFERGLAGGVEQFLSQFRDQGDVSAIPEQPQGCLAAGFRGAVEFSDELL
jgi:hypothetical protein